MTHARLRAEQLSTTATYIRRRHRENATFSSLIVARAYCNRGRGELCARVDCALHTIAYSTKQSVATTNASSPLEVYQQRQNARHTIRLLRSSSWPTNETSPCLQKFTSPVNSPAPTVAIWVPCLATSRSPSMTRYSRFCVTSWVVRISPGAAPPQKKNKKADTTEGAC